MGNKEDDKLNELKNLENQFQTEENNEQIKLTAFSQEQDEEQIEQANKEVVFHDVSTEDEDIEEDEEETITVATDTPTYQTTNGYRILTNTELPYLGALYPETWRFSFRCPTTDEVAEFSTIDERDTPKIQDAITNLLKKCYVIVDTKEGKQIPSSQLNDGDRLFFFLKLREFYMQDIPIEFPIISQNHQEPLQVNLMAHNLIFNTIKPELLEYYDGRKWSIPTESFGLKDPIVFINPTLDISQRIFKYMVNKYREAQDSKNQKINKNEFNRKFLLLLPFLYVEGNEKIESLNLKFKQIQKNEKLLQAYLTLSNKMVNTNEEYLVITYKGDEEKTDIKFPGGWKNMFIDQQAFGGLFD